MSLMRKLLAGLSSIALTMAPGIGVHQALSADEPASESSSVTTLKPLAAMTLAELYNFVTTNIDPTAVSAEQAALRFARMLASVTGADEPTPGTLMAVANALQIMLEEVENIHGPIQTDAVLAAARATYLSELSTAAGPTVQPDDGTVGPDLTEVADTPY